VRRHLADGPRTQAELVALLVADGFPRVAWAGAQLWVDVLRVPPAGTWDTPRAHVFALAEQVLPVSPPIDDDVAKTQLVARYLGAFGPASAQDASSFTGLSIGGVRAALARLDLRQFHTETGVELVDLPDAPLPPAATPVPVRFLGTWDATLLVHARRTQLLPEEYRQQVFDVSMPRSVPTFLVDGQVAGTWRFVDARVEWTPFHDLATAARRAVDDEAERLAAWHS
jgi:hypothetical protein